MIRRGPSCESRGSRSAAVLALLMMVLSGCRSDPQAPIADSTMVNLLIEFHLANARAEAVGSYPVHLRDSIFARYGVDSATYSRASEFYGEHPDQYGEIYSRVLDRLNVERLSLPTDTARGAIRSSQSDSFPRPASRAL